MPCLAGCAGTAPTVVTKYQKLATPTELRSCKPEPQVNVTSDQELAGYVLDLREAGQDCRDKLGRRNTVEDGVK